ncbi:hypothetical protein [Paraburkholderia ferrariae]|uniref:Uncharacterized protein n=1 Tax=Paraburkholderia ferrariae TaxID=386056 RepID=A0ABU9S2H8_9BURK
MLADSPGRAQSLRLSGSQPRVAIRALDDVARAADAIMYSCLAVDGVPASAPTAVALKGAIAQMARAMQEVSGSTAHVEQAALEIVEGNANLSARTEHQAGSLEAARAGEQGRGFVRRPGERVVNKEIFP